MEEIDEGAYYDHELYLHYSRAFRGALNTHLIRSNYTEVASPFLNTEFFQLCMDIPIHVRANHALYKKWILTKYPQAAKFKYEGIHGYISDPEWIIKLRKRANSAFGKAARLSAAVQGGEWYPQSNMNPFDYWASHNPKVSKFLAEYERTHYDYLPAGTSSQLKEDMRSLFRTGDVEEKTMVLTLLSAAKLYFGDGRDGRE